MDFGVEALPERLKESELDPDDLASERPDAPVLMPAYLDLWSQTSPRPAADPEVGLFLHGAERTAAGVSIVWRGDITEADLGEMTGVDLKQVIRLVPPRAAEAVEVPLWAARAWLRRPKDAHADISDAPQREPETQTAPTKPTDPKTSLPVGGPRRSLHWASSAPMICGPVIWLGRSVRLRRLRQLRLGAGIRLMRCRCPRMRRRSPIGAGVARSASHPASCARNDQWQRHIASCLSHEDVNGLDSGRPPPRGATVRSSGRRHARRTSVPGCTGLIGCPSPQQGAHRCTPSLCRRGKGRRHSPRRARDIRATRLIRGRPRDRG